MNETAQAINKLSFALTVSLFAIILNLVAIGVYLNGILKIMKEKK